MHESPKHHAKGTRRREQIIHAATRIFCEEGYDSATFNHVAEAVGLREASLFYYFRRKQDLLCAVLAEQDPFGGHGSDSTKAPGLELQRVAPLAKHNTQRSGFAALLSVATATANAKSHEAHGYFRNRYTALTRALSDDIEQKQREGRVRNDLGPEDLARIVLAALDGLQLQWLYDNEVPVDSTLDDLISKLLAALG
jgi:AcrR family transcriptional regulator